MQSGRSACSMIGARSKFQPLVRSVRGRSTIYLQRRRFLLPAQYTPGEPLPMSAALPAVDAEKQDRAKRQWIGTDLIPEVAINTLADLLSFSLPRGFSLAFLCALALANLACLIIVSLASMPSQAFLWTPWELALAVGLILFLHELGHCIMARKLGIRVDSLGAGIYLVFPALYSRISLASLLTWRERIDLFLAGIVVQAYLTLVMAMAHFLTPTISLRRAIFINLALMLFNLMPILRFDGYRILKEIMDHRLDDLGRRRVTIACRWLTVAFLVGAGTSLILSLRTALPRVLSTPSIDLVIQCALGSVFLIFLILAAPAWLRRPHG